MEKIIQFDKDVLRYFKLAEERSAKEDYMGALKFLLSAKAIKPNDFEVSMRLADCYADMSLLELSNKYWFKYLDSAPKERQAIAYEELAINYFYLDNYWASSYYFHKKLDVDGFISKENLSQEIIDFFSGEEVKNNIYRIAYPFDRADYTYEIKKSKHLIALGAFEEAVSTLEKIPEERLDEETAGELAVSCFMSDNLDRAEEVCRFSLEKHGENITAFCNLSTVYDMREDFDNSDYYYNKALLLRTGSVSEAYKLATCSIEREDHTVAKECLEKILQDRPYENAMRFFYGIALCNLKKYKSAYEQIKIAHTLDPDDIAIKFHLDCVKILYESGQDVFDLMPFKYVKDIPEKIAEEWNKKIKNLLKTPEKFSSALKKTHWQNILEWGLKGNDVDIARDCAFILSSVFNPYAKGVIMQALLNPEGREELKRVLIYVALINGVKEKFGVVAGNFYLKIKPRKLACERDKIFGGLYLSAYALCTSRMAFFDVDGLDKIARACDKVYKKLKGLVTDAEATNEEIAGLILSECKYKKYSNDLSVTRMFSVTEEKLATLKKILKGE